MRRGQGWAAIMGLTMIMAIVLGFWGGFRLLPGSALARSPAFSGRLLSVSLPNNAALAAEPAQPEAAMPETATPLAELPMPTSMPESTGREKAAPRLIMIAEDSVAAFAALNVAEAADGPQATGLPRIAVYCTHSSEEYKNQARKPGSRGGVHTVAKRLCDSLNAAGLATIYCDTIHDYPDWDLSYTSSLASIQSLQQQYPSLEVFIDVHRDSLANSVLATASGQVARIMLVVGSNKRLEHPNWQKNKSFAERIQQTLDAFTPGLTRSVNVQDGRYNQHVSTKAILVEMGSTANTVEEACKSAELLAKALAEILK